MLTLVYQSYGISVSIPYLAVLCLRLQLRTDMQIFSFHFKLVQVINFVIMLLISCLLLLTFVNEIYEIVLFGAFFLLLIQIGMFIWCVVMTAIIEILNFEISNIFNLC